MMTSQNGARILRFRKNNFINKYLTSKFLLLLIFIVLSPFVQENPILDPFSSQFWVDDVITLSQNVKILRERFHKGIIHLKIRSYFWFLFSYQRWYLKYRSGPFSAIFGMTASLRDVKTFKKVKKDKIFR